MTFSFCLLFVFCSFLFSGCIFYVVCVVSCVDRFPWRKAWTKLSSTSVGSLSTRPTTSTSPNLKPPAWRKEDPDTTEVGFSISNSTKTQKDVKTPQSTPWRVTLWNTLLSRALWDVVSFFEKQRQLSLKSLKKKKSLKKSLKKSVALHWSCSSTCVVRASLPELAFFDGLGFEARNLKPRLPFLWMLLLLFKSQTWESCLETARTVHLLRVYFMSFMMFCLQRWATWLCFSTGCFVLLSVAFQPPVGCWLGKSSRKTVTASLHVYQDIIVFTLWNLMSRCALSISDKDAILIKYFQYVVYDIIRE